MAILSFAQTVSASLIAVTLAAAGIGAAALVLGPLAASALAAALVFAMVGGSLPRWRGREARELLRFGLLTLGSGLLKVGWEDVVTRTRILAVAGMASVVQGGTTPLIVALGRPGVLLGWNLTSMLMLGAVTFAFAPLGLVWLSVAVTVFYVIRVGVGQELLV